LQLMALRPINDRWGSRLGSSRERSPLGSGRAQGLAVGLSRGQVGQGFDRSRDIVQRGLMTVTDGFRLVLTVSCGHGSHPSENRPSRERSIVATLGHVTETAGSSTEDELTPAPPGLFRYHGGANTVLCAGVATGLLFASPNWLPAWGGFLAGAVPAFLLTALSHTLRDE